MDARQQIIVHAEPVKQINEAPLLPRMVRRTVHTLRRAGLTQATQARVVADTNYFTEDNARFLLDSALDGYIPDNQFRNRDQRFAERSIARRARHRRFTQADVLYDAASDSYCRPADKSLGRHTRATAGGPRGTSYRAEESDCSECELACRCLKSNGKIATSELIHSLAIV